MRALVMALVASLAVAACDPTWATVVENGSEQAVFIRVETQPFSGDGTFTTDFIVEPGSRINVGGSGVASVGQVVRISILDEACDAIESETVVGFEEGGVVVLGADGRISLVAGGNPTAGNEAATTDTCA